MTAMSLIEAVLTAVLQQLDGQKPDSEKLSDQALVVYRMLHDQIAFLKNSNGR